LVVDKDLRVLTWCVWSSTNKLFPILRTYGEVGVADARVAVFLLERNPQVRENFFRSDTEETVGLRVDLNRLDGGESRLF